MKKVKATPYQEIPVDLILVNPEQPRVHFDQAELQQLAATIREYGVIEPVTVEACDGEYILHDGERRWRAAILAGLKQVPAIVTPPLNGTGPRQRLERALVANVQRSEMHPIEEGLAYQRLITEFGYTLREVGERVGKHYTRVHQCLELLKLDEEIRQLMLERRLPCERKSVSALMQIEDPKERVKLAQALAERQATARMVVLACRKFLGFKGEARLKQDGTPAYVRSGKLDKPEWDALYQLGRVPPWPVVNDAVMKTCDNCALRQMASPRICKDCAVVAFLDNILEATDE